MSYLVAPLFDHSTPAKTGDPAPTGAPGIYRLTYVLAVPGRNVVQNKVDFAELEQGGDSLLEVPAKVSLLRVDLDDGAGGQLEAIVHVNASHRLRDVALEIRADSFTQAETVGHDLIAPLLSRWSYLHDVAITVSALQIVETATQTYRWSLLMIGAVKAFSDTAGVNAPDHRVLLSAYRDGISSTEPLWQALSLFRVAEGVVKMRQARTAAVVAAGLIPPGLPERVPADVRSVGEPNDPAVRDSLRPFAGKKFTTVLDDVRPTLRNAIAHLDPDGTVLVQDRWADLQKVEQALPALRWIALQLLDTELQPH